MQSFLCQVCNRKLSNCQYQFCLSAIANCPGGVVWVVSSPLGGIWVVRSKPALVYVGLFFRTKTQVEIPKNIFLVNESKHRFIHAVVKYLPKQMWHMQTFVSEKFCKKLHQSKTQHSQKHCIVFILCLHTCEYRDVGSR